MPEFVTIEQHNKALATIGTHKKTIEVLVGKYKTVAQTCVELQHTLKQINERFKNRPEGEKIPERMAAIEKQLKNALAIIEENSKNITVFGNMGETVRRDVFHEKMTKKEINHVLFNCPTDDEVMHELHYQMDRLKIHVGITGKKPEELKMYPEWCNIVEKSGLGKALNVSGSPANWIPAAWSAEMLTYYQQALRVSTLFERFPMSAKTVNWPFLDTGFTVNLIGEPGNQDPPSNIDATKPGQSNIQLNSKTFGGRLRMSMEIEEDAIDDFVPRIRNNIVPRGMAEAEEDAILNGDTASTHQDKDSNGNNIGGSDRRTAFLGIRADALDESATFDVQSGDRAYAYSSFAQVLKKHSSGMGVDPSEGGWVFSNSAYLDATDFDKVTENPQLVAQLVSPVINGAVNVIHGRPVIVSGKYPETMDSTGVVPATAGTLTGFTHVNRMQYIIGDRREETMVQIADHEAQEIRLVITKRMAFQKLQPSGNATSASGINVPTT